MDTDRLDRAEALLGFKFEDRDLLTQALTHASATEERLESNERLEFLGDAVLGLVICEYVYRNFPDVLEGEMTKIKSTVVSRRSCSEVADRLELSSLLELGKGMMSRSSTPSSVGAAVFESLIGAAFLEGGLEAARAFILQELRQKVHVAEESGHHQNFKSVLQQHAQQVGGHSPVYTVLDEQGPDHAKCFEVGVEINGRSFRPCWGSSKKEAEQDAALEALIELGCAVRDEEGGIHLN
ncbi:MAG: ribonuclease III [Phycisphaerales bacterium]|nr:ribonuclease III [Phycisphaerales bacterium]